MSAKITIDLYLTDDELANVDATAAAMNKFQEELPPHIKRVEWERKRLLEVSAMVGFTHFHRTHVSGASPAIA